MQPSERKEAYDWVIPLIKPTVGALVAMGALAAGYSGVFESGAHAPADRAAAGELAALDVLEKQIDARVRQLEVWSAGHEQYATTQSGAFKEQIAALQYDVHHAFELMERNRELIETNSQRLNRILDPQGFSTGRRNP